MQSDFDRPRIPGYFIAMAAEYRRKVASGEIQPITPKPVRPAGPKRKRSRSPLIEAMQLGA